MNILPPVKDSLGQVWRIRWEGLGFFRMQNQRGRNEIWSKEKYLKVLYKIW